MGQNCGRGDRGRGVGGVRSGRGEGFVPMADLLRAKMNVSGTADIHKRHYRSGAGAFAEVAGCSVEMFV